ncbi:male sterility protein-domain-containing protein [Halteromyces radiatus]|uniref:male sterility protein-domain-containing protein n=1 Tax=Halteromyces radiatus TaxID=101107 RepID=UPI00222072A5|nr:male sterility protein-domain-containing protein [Halteromyces radiatus]KAI8096845.1 male sterility protein-domain-containing protein [Halteromyces radiatus]
MTLTPTIENDNISHSDLDQQHVPSIVISQEDSLIETNEILPVSPQETQLEEIPTQQPSPSLIQEESNHVSINSSCDSPSIVPELETEQPTTEDIKVSITSTKTQPEVSATNIDMTTESITTTPAPAMDVTVAADTILQGSVAQYYQNKNILLTGATGFIGKAVLWKLIHSLGRNLGRIYLLVRNGNTKRSKMGRPNDRIKNEILNNKAFVSLRHSMGESVFDTIIQNKIIPISGDIISPDLSMSHEDRENVIENVHVVIHCAATVDYHERLDLALETNTLGTLRLMDLADECVRMESFVHVSLAYLNANLPDGHIQERVYPMDLGDPEDLLKEIVALELQDIPKMTQRILQHYPNTYTFTKSLTEHLILKRVDYNRVEEIQGGKAQWPISIVRATHVGAGALEPLPGWVDGVTGMNGMVFLMGHGIQVLQPDIGNNIADIVPVDFLSRVIIGSPVHTSSPGVKFVLPYNEILRDDEEPTRQRLPQVQYFPIIHQVSARNMKPVSWKHIYESVRHYWTRNTKATLPTAEQYFVSNKSLFKARLFMKYQLPQSLNAVSAAISGNGSSNTSNAFGTNNRMELNVINRTVEVASRMAEANQPLLRHQWLFENDNVYKLESHLEVDPDFQLSGFYTNGFDWDSYMTNFSYGAHIYIAQGPIGTRNLTLAPGWDCALFSKVPVVRNSIIDRQIESVVFSLADIQKRTDRMLTQVITSLEQPTLAQLGSLNGLNDSNNSNNNKKLSEDWIADFDTSLDDWCHDDSGILTDGKHTADLGRWVTRIGEHDEAIKIIVLNDRRVGASIRQIIESSGVPQQTVVGEALKIVQRMRERTQLAYVWFAGSFLDALFKRLFACIRVRDEDIFKLKEQIKGKNVVYVPVSKTLLDQLLVWYICLRYHLPVPAIVCDEALALLGPISDILRIAGAYFIRRDKMTRSPLNTAVAAAYTEALLHEHGALSMLLERARSRTGRIQAVYADGILDMVVEATIEGNQQVPRTLNQQSSPPSPAPSFDSHQTTTSSLDSSTGKETVVVPIHITYEKIPDLRMLIDQVLDQKAKEAKVDPPATLDGTPMKGAATTRLSRSTSFLRPSTSVAGRAASKENGMVENGKYGRVYVGIGNVVDINKAKDQVLDSLDKNESLSSVDKHAKIAAHIAKSVQHQQHSSTIVSPVSVIAAIVLFGRTSNGISLGKINGHAEWLRNEVREKGMSIDWQDGEDAETIVAYSLNLLDIKTNIIIEGGKRINENTTIRVVDHADNVMDLSYMANQIIEIFLPEAIFSVVYLSYGPKSVLTRDELFAKFTFLVRLLKDEFIYTWNIVETFDQLLQWFSSKGFLVVKGDHQFEKSVMHDSDHKDYNQICLFASFLYPTLDAYWITSCSLSALRDLPYMPRKIVPVLSQWIAAHLISGRRTVYREVLSTEASQNAVDNFMAIGFIDAVHPKTKLSPDAQILLLELGIKTNEDLVMVSDRSHGKDNVYDEKNGNSQVDSNSDILSQLLDIASLCHEIEKYRFGAGDAQLLGLRQNAQVFDKCQNQIRSILRAEQSYSSQHGMQLIRDEDQMIQLVYSLKASANVALTADGSGNGRNPRRVSEAYNLKSSYRDNTL